MIEFMGPPSPLINPSECSHLVVGPPSHLCNEDGALNAVRVVSTPNDLGIVIAFHASRKVALSNQKRLFSHFSRDVLPPLSLARVALAANVWKGIPGAWRAVSRLLCHLLTMSRPQATPNSSRDSFPTPSLLRQLTGLDTTYFALDSTSLPAGSKRVHRLGGHTFMVAR